MKKIAICPRCNTPFPVSPMRAKISELCDGTRTTHEIATIVGCHQSYVNKVANQDRRKFKRARPSQREKRNHEIYRRFKLGEMQKNLAREFGVSTHRIHKIIRKQSQEDYQARLTNIMKKDVITINIRKASKCDSTPKSA